METGGPRRGYSVETGARLRYTALHEAKFGSKPALPTRSAEPSAGGVTLTLELGGAGDDSDEAKT